MSPRKRFRCGVIGYSPAFNMGWAHLEAMTKNPGMEAAAVCDLDPEYRAAAARDWPGATVYSRVGDMLRRAELDLVAVITPHNTHARLVLKCLDAGAGVVCEKPLAITSREIRDMIAMSRRRKVMLSTFHNRRWDTDFLLLRDLIHKEKAIGEPFRIECGFYRYGESGPWWRSDKKISGGAIYDWGAHFTDWVLQLVSDEIDWVSGFQVKNPAWGSYTNEDHSEYTLKFKGGCEVTQTISNLSMSPRPRWRVLGDRGAIEAVEEGFLLRTLVNGRQMSAVVPVPERLPTAELFYANVYRHLQGRAKLAVTAESAARVIGVLEAANLSAARGSSPVKPAFK